MKNETRTKQGLAIINPYGGIWTDVIFDKPEDALKYLVDYWKNAPIRLEEFKLAVATQTLTVYRPPGEATFIELPKR